MVEKSEIPIPDDVRQAYSYLKEEISLHPNDKQFKLLLMFFTCQAYEMGWDLITADSEYWQGLNQPG